MPAITATRPAPSGISPDISERGSRQPRAQGRMRLSARLRGSVHALAELHQQGSARALFPREACGELVGVLLNTAGGVTGGDRFTYSAEAEAGVTLTLTTQAAERVYRAQPGEIARIETRLTLGAGSRLDWLPQETIVFDGAALGRSLAVEMAADARLLAVEAVVLGRQAMGERVARAHFTDRWRISRAGRLVYADALRLEGPVAAIAAGPGTFGANRAAATVVLVAPDAGDRLAPARALLARDADEAVVAGAPATEAGASLRDGVLVARLLAPDSRTLRRALVCLLAGLRGAPLPRVWTI